MTKKILVLLLAVCSLFCFVACGSAKSVTAEAPAPTVDYTKGSISNNVYTNEWANIKFELDSTTWKQGSTADYASYETEGTECGLIAGIATEGRQLAIAFEENPRNYNEESYLDNATKAMKELVAGYTFSEYYKKTIAGKEYLGVDITLTQNGATIHQAMYVKLYDGKFIGIVGTSITSKDEIASVIGKITTVK